jgi:hypothetical protein
MYVHVITYLIIPNSLPTPTRTALVFPQCMVVVGLTFLPSNPSLASGRFQRHKPPRFTALCRVRRFRFPSLPRKQHQNKKNSWLKVLGQRLNWRHHTFVAGSGWRKLPVVILEELVETCEKYHATHGTDWPRHSPDAGDDGDDDRRDDIRQG